MTIKMNSARALVAIVFTSGFLSSEQPTLCKNTNSLTDSLIEGTANNESVAPQLRASRLLILANEYLTTRNPELVEATYATFTYHAVKELNYNPRLLENSLLRLTNRTFSEQKYSNHKSHEKEDATLDAQSMEKEQKTLANEALLRALEELHKVDIDVATLTMYFIASKLFEKVGNVEGKQSCDKVLENTFQDCEGSLVADEEQIRAANLVLNLKANELIPVDLPERTPSQESARPLTRVKQFTQKTYLEAEVLRLRALDMADRLEPTSHVRRKAHRDMALWYLNLGKTDFAEVEKRTLFDLVGFEDDSVLYPQLGTCGHLVWWRQEKIKILGFCGMG